MNWKQEAIDRLQKYTAMEKAVENLPEELKRVEQQSYGLTSKPDTLRVDYTPKAGDNAMLNHLVHRQELEMAYENARIWVSTTRRAMLALTREDQAILYSMYVQPQKGAVNKLCEQLGVEQSSVYRKRDSALYRFTLALYGAA